MENLQFPLTLEMLCVLEKTINHLYRSGRDSELTSLLKTHKIIGPNTPHRDKVTEVAFNHLTLFISPFSLTLLSFLSSIDIPQK